jgi:YVTN family beta-propeller protein
MKFKVLLLAVVLLSGLLRGHASPAAAEAQVIAHVAVGRYPQDLALNPNTNRIYVPTDWDNTMSVINGASNAVITTVPINVSRKYIAVNPTTNRIYLDSYNGYCETIAVLDGATNASVADIPLCGDTNHMGLAVNPSTNRIYAANNLDPGSVWVIDGGTNTIVDTVTVGSDPMEVAVNPNTNRIYVTNDVDPGSVSVINGSSDAIIATVPVGRQPEGVAVNPNTNRIYVANTMDGTVSVINGASNAVMAIVPIDSYQTCPLVIDVNPNMNRTYVGTCTRTVSVIDGPSNTVVDTVFSNNSPGYDPVYGIAVNPNTNRVYAANYTSDTVSVIQDSERTMPNFKQCDSRWKNHILDGIPPTTICDAGCALTSVADVVSSWGASTDPDILNNWLKVNGGYTSYGCIYWGKAASYAHLPAPVIYYNNYNHPDFTGLRTSLDSGQPVILGVASGGYCPGHYVVATKTDGSTWWINDPAGPATTLATYGNSFCQRVVYPSGGSSSRLAVHAHSPVELLLTDPLGRRLGFDPSTGTSYDEIPDASYGMDGTILSEDGSETIVPGLKTAWLNSPVDGQYTIEAIGTDTGSYLVDGEASDTNGGITDITGPSGTTSPGQVDTGVIHYSSQPASVGGIADMPDVPGAHLEASASHTSRIPVPAEVAAALAAGIIALGVGGWYARSRRHNARGK